MKTGFYNSARLAEERGRGGKEKKGQPDSSPRPTLLIPVLTRPTKGETLSDIAHRKSAEAEEIAGYMGDLRPVMDDWIMEVWSCTGLQEAALISIQEELRQRVAEVKKHLQQETEALRLAAITAYSVALIGGARDMNQVAGLFEDGLLGLPSLRSLGVVAEEVSGTRGDDIVRCGRKAYRVEKADVLAAVRALAARVRGARVEQHKKDLEEILQKATIKPEDVRLFASGKATGTIVLFVPDELGERDGERFTHPGGEILVESDGERVMVVSVAGKFATRIAKCIEAVRSCGIRGIPLEQFGWDNMYYKEKRLEKNVFYALKGLYWAIKKGMEATSKRNQRAVEVKKRREEAKAEAEVLQAKAPITLANMAIGHHGLAFFHLPKWEVRNAKREVETTIYQVMGIVKRDEHGVRLVEYPERLRGFFGDRFSKPLPASSEGFEMLPAPLKQLLRSALTREERSAARNCDEHGGEKLPDLSVDDFGGEPEEGGEQ